MRFYEIAAARSLDSVFQDVADYIQHNQAADLSALAAELRSHGYVEPFGAGTYYRALFHRLTPEDHKLAHTAGELTAVFTRELRMRLGEPQGFTTSLDSAIQFIRGTLHIMHNSPPIHRPEMPVDEIDDLILIYEAQAPVSSILFSMRGLKRFMKGKSGPGWDALDHSMNDMFEGYGADDEVVIDTSQIKISGVHMYDSSED